MNLKRYRNCFLLDPEQDSLKIIAIPAGPHPHHPHSKYVRIIYFEFDGSCFLTNESLTDFSL